VVAGVGNSREMREQRKEMRIGIGLSLSVYSLITTAYKGDYSFILS